MPIRAAIVEDDAIIRDGLRLLIELIPEVDCVGAFANAETATTGIPNLAPHVVLMDINLPGQSGTEAVAQLSAVLPETRFIMLTVKADPDAIFNSFAAGADGYLLKPATAKELESAIHDALSGGAPMTSHIARLLVKSFRFPAQAPRSPISKSTVELSDREKQVLELIAKGLAYKEVADDLGIAYATVHTHVKRIYGKLRVRGRMEAVRKYFQQ